MRRATSEPRPATGEPRRNHGASGLGLGLQLDVAVGQFDRVFHFIAAVLFADLFGLFLDKRGERIETDCDFLAGLVLGCNQDVVETFHLLALRLIDTVQREMRRGVGAVGSAGRVAHAVSVMMMRFVLLLFANTLNGEDRVLWAAVALFPDTGFLAPEIAVNGVALRYLVVAIALGETHASPVGELAQKSHDLPLDIRWRTLLGIAEENFVLDLQAAQLSVEYVQFFVGRHKSLPRAP